MRAVLAGLSRTMLQNRTMKAVFNLLLVVAVFYNVRQTDSSEENRDCYALSTLNTTCVVNYTSTLTLQCPNTTSVEGSWWRVRPGGEIVSVCDSAACVVDGENHRLHNDDSGQYFCRVPVNYTYQEYYVNVTVLAPPSIICKLCTCKELASDCVQPLISRYIRENVVLSVEFFGKGPFSVVWQLNGSILDCSNNTADMTQCTVRGFSNTTYGYEHLTLPAPHLNISKDSGIFNAVVTNAYGYNMTTQRVDIECQAVDPPQSNGDNGVNMTTGETKNVTLRTMGSQQIYLWLCYTRDEYTTMQNITLKTSCVKCRDQMLGYCGNLPNRPRWAVSRNQIGTCFEQTLLELTVLVTDVRETDRGKFIMTWSSDEEEAQGPQKHAALTTTTLGVTAGSSRADGENSRYGYVPIAAAGAGTILLMVITVVVVFMAVKKRRKVRNARQNRRQRRQANYAAGVVCAGRPQWSESENTSGSDTECLRNPISPASSYGSIADNHPPVTSENEPVTLSSDDNVNSHAQPI